MSAAGPPTPPLITLPYLTSFLFSISHGIYSVVIITLSSRLVLVRTLPHPSAYENSLTRQAQKNDTNRALSTRPHTLTPQGLS